MDAITTRKNGFAEMAYVGDTPWHGQGQQLTAGAPLEVWKHEAGMDWELKRSRVRFGDGQLFDQHHVLFRGDTKAPLSIVSPKYQIVQPGQVLEFFRDLVELQGYALTTAGTLFGGKRFWALARVSADEAVAGQDAVGGYLLLCSSCDGSLATTATPTTVRVVCNNTLTMALGGATKAVAVRHTSAFDAGAVKAKLGLARGAFAEFMTAARQLAKTPVTKAAAGKFLERLLVDTKTVFTEDVTKSRQYQAILALFDGEGRGAGLPGAEGTAWGLLNSVTQFVDHQARAKTVDARLASAWFGRGDALKTAAAQRALALI